MNALGICRSSLVDGCEDQFLIIRGNSIPRWRITAVICMVFVVFCLHGEHVLDVLEIAH